MTSAAGGYPPGPAHAPGITADFLYRRAVTIYGGSNEIQRNLIARHLLGSLIAWTSPSTKNRRCCATAWAASSRRQYGFEQRRAVVAQGGFSARTGRSSRRWAGSAPACPSRRAAYGGSAIDTALIAEQLGRGLVLEPFVEVAVLAAHALLPAARAPRRGAPRSAR